MTGPKRRLVVVAALYVSQAVPLGFFIIALPAIMRRQGLALEHVGLLGALALPWLGKFLWAPLVDRYGWQTFGHYRSWILPLQSLCVITVVVIAALEPASRLGWVLVAGAAFMLLSATQDVATDGLAVRILRETERGTGNGIQVGGYYAGQIMGGGVALALFDRIGWSATLLVMAAVLALPVVVVARFDEAAEDTARHDGPRRLVHDFGALRRFFTRPGASLWVLILVLFRGGEAMALTMLNPMLVDRGLGLDRIAVATGLVMSLAALAGAVTGGALVERIGRRPALAAFGILQAAATAGYLLPAYGPVGLPLLYLVVSVAGFAGAMATAALYTNMMDRSDPHTAATDFTLQQSLCAIGPLLGSALSGFSAARFGYAGHFLLCASLALAAAVLVARYLTSATAAPLGAAAALGALERQPHPSS